MQDFLNAANDMLETIFMVEPGTTNFIILLGLSLGALLLFGKPIAVHVFGGKAGWVASFFGMALPVAFLILGLAAADLYLSGQIESQTWQMVAKISSGSVLFLLGGLLTGKFLLRIGFVKSLIAVLLTCALAYACMYMGKYGLESFAAGSKQAESYRSRSDF